MMGPLTITMLAMAAGSTEGKQAEMPSLPPPAPPPVIMAPPAPPPSPVITRPRPTGPNLKPTPIGSAGSYVGSWDYPAKALRENRSGSTTVELAISRWGTVADCRVTSSSGHADLDTASCERLATRARFWPATDAKGEPTSGTHTQTVRWAMPTSANPTIAPPPIMTVPIPAATTLFPRAPRTREYYWASISEKDWPEGALAAGREGEAKVSFDIGTDGAVTACRVVTSSGHADLDARSCAIVRDRAKFEPALGIDGAPTVSRGEQTIRWKKPVPPVVRPAAPAMAEWRNRPAVMPAFMSRPGEVRIRMTLGADGKATKCDVDASGGMKGVAAMSDGFCKEARTKGFRSMNPDKDPLPREVEATLQINPKR